MKKLLLILLFSGSLDGFSQVNGKIDTSSHGINAFVYPMRTGEVKDIDRIIYGSLTPDTLRCTLIVYTTAARRYFTLSQDL